MDSRVVWPKDLQDIHTYMSDGETTGKRVQSRKGWRRTKRIRGVRVVGK